MRSSPMMSSTEREGRPLLRELADRWWLFLMRGIAAIAFGLAVLIWPSVTLMALVLLYGGFAIVDGVLSIAAAIQGTEYDSRWWFAIVGLLGVVAGVVTLLWPGISGLVLLLCIAVWAIASGIVQIVGAIAMRDQIDDEWLLIASGALSVIFGALLLSRPGAGAVALAVVIAAYALMYGGLLIALAFRLRGHAHSAGTSQ